jgi:DNA-binding CsgD family transcriptional regulator
MSSHSINRRQISTPRTGDPGGKLRAPGSRPSGLCGQPEAALAALDGLTPREREVVGWVAEGKRDAEIGAILGVSARTVETHVHRILRKLGVETRTGAARIVFQAGLDGDRA